MSDVPSQSDATAPAGDFLSEQTPTEPGRLAPATGGLERRDWQWLLLVIVLAFGVRAVYVFQVRSAPWFSSEILDEQYHDQWARAILRGEAFAPAPYFKPPMYAWFLAGVYAVTGGDYLAARLVQSALGAINCGLLFLLGRACFGLWPAVGAGLGGAICWTLVFHDAELLDPVLAGFFNLLMMLAMVRAANSHRARPWIAAGVLMGVSTLTKANVLMFAPFAVIWAWWSGRGAGGGGLKRACLLLAACAATMLPVTARNLIAGRDFVLVASHGGLNFFIGNNADADGINAFLPGARPDLEGMSRDAASRAERESGRTLKPSEVSRFYYGEAWRFIREHPEAAAGLLWRKLRFFWSGEELPNTKDLYYITEQYAPVLRWCAVSFAFVGPLGLLGLIVSAGRGRELFPLWGFVLTYMASVVLFFVNTRFRLPVVYPLIVYASYGFVWLREEYQQQRWRSIGWGLPVLGAAAALVLFGAPMVARTHAENFCQEGKVKYQAGQFTVAYELYRKAVGMRPQSIEARMGLAACDVALGKEDQAVSELRTVLRFNPHLPAAVVSLANYLIRDARNLAVLRKQEESSARLKEAATLLVGCVTHAQEAERPYVVLGDLFSLTGHPQQAAQQYQAALVRNDKDVGALRGMGSLLAQMGQWTPAAGFLRRALSASPDTPGLCSEVVSALTQGGAYAEAVTVLREQLARRVDDMDSTLALASLLARAPEASVRNGAEAVRLAERARDATKGENAHAMATLASAYAETGRFDEAIKAMQRAIELVGKNLAPGADVVKKHLGQQLEMFQRRQPYRLPLPTTQPALPLHPATRPAGVP